jgi:hypothetical protein
MAGVISDLKSHARTLHRQILGGEQARLREYAASVRSCTAHSVDHSSESNGTAARASIESALMTLLDWSRKARAAEDRKLGRSWWVVGVIAAVLLWLTLR